MDLICTFYSDQVELIFNSAISSNMISLKSLKFKNVRINLHENDLKYIKETSFINQLPQNISNFTNLKNLCLEYFDEQISLNEGFLQDLVQLEELKLHYIFNSIDSDLQFLFKNLIKLKKLLFLHNKMLTVKSSYFKYLVHLEEVYLSYNQINLIESDPFKNSTNLKYLDLSGNADLKDIQKDAFKSNRNLERLTFCN